MSSVIAPEAFRVRDAIPLPAPDEPLGGSAERSERYSVHVTRSIEATLSALAELAAGRAVGIVVDATVEALYGRELIGGLRARGVDVLARAVRSGEASKSLDEAVRLWHWLAHSPLARRDLLVTFGGGVVNDLGGWVASAYMRGLPYVNLPTTLLAQVDGALGGKVAVNHEVAKNLLGAFYQPAAVIADVSLLRTLERRHLSAGLAECVKKAMIASPAYWDLISARAEPLLSGDVDALEALVRGAVAIKTALIARDPYELDLRRPLNFGHTIGHPLETVTGYRPLLHGEAVAFGMVIESRIAVRRRLMPAELLEALIELLRRCALPVHARDLRARIRADAVIGAMEKVRLIRAGSLRFVLPVALGETVIADDVHEDEVRVALREVGVD